jgi:hypothetical protein
MSKLVKKVALVTGGSRGSVSFAGALNAPKLNPYDLAPPAKTMRLTGTLRAARASSVFTSILALGSTVSAIVGSRRRS